MVLFEKHSPAFHDILAVGDAAGVRDPFTGDGQASAMTSGVLAASSVGEFLSGNLASRDLAARYGSLWSERLGARFGWDAIFRRAMLSPALQKLALPFAAPLVSLGFPVTRS
jgi:flavin-dependent dehydrogenase